MLELYISNCSLEACFIDSKKKNVFKSYKFKIESKRIVWGSLASYLLVKFNCHQITLSETLKLQLYS